MKPAEWIWMPHGAHHILRDRCAFRLATFVGDHIVSTVGEVIPRDSKTVDYGNVGSGRRYECYVFAAELAADRKCCPYEIDCSVDTVETYGCNCPSEATAKHMEMCRKYGAIHEANRESLLN